MSVMSSKEAQMEARLRARPLQVTGSAPVGLQPLMLGAARDRYLYVPTTYRADRPAPLVLLLHGAEGTPDRAWTCCGAWRTQPVCCYSPLLRAITRGTCSSIAVTAPTRPSLSRRFPATPSIRCVWQSGV